MPSAAVLGDFLGSPYYWAFVVALAVAFSVVDFFALDPRELGRKQGWAVALYVASWGILIGLSLPIAPVGSLWWTFPWAFRIAVAAALVGGHVPLERLAPSKLSRITRGVHRRPGSTTRKGS